MNKSENIFSRNDLLFNDYEKELLKTVKIILFGVGGVGSWCAEALIRLGIQNLTIVDDDVICITNVNRQAEATSLNIGKIKVDEMKLRLKSINPDANIKTINLRYSPENRDLFGLENYDIVIDAIDSLDNKLDLIQSTLSLKLKLFSSMGAALKFDNTMIRTSSVWKTKNCPLAKLVRKRLRQNGVYSNFLCVWTEEIPEKKREKREKQPNGALVHVTGTFGFALAGLVICEIRKKAENISRH